MGDNIFKRPSSVPKNGTQNSGCVWAHSYCSGKSDQSIQLTARMDGLVVKALDRILETEVKFLALTHVPEGELLDLSVA